MKSKNVGVGDVLTQEERAKRDAKKLGEAVKPIVEKKLPSCRRRYESKEECLAVQPPYASNQKCDLCGKGGKL